jgi:hypothetical protein
MALVELQLVKSMVTHQPQKLQKRIKASLSQSISMRSPANVAEDVMGPPWKDHSAIGSCLCHGGAMSTAEITHRLQYANPLAKIKMFILASLNAYERSDDLSEHGESEQSFAFMLALSLDEI